MMKFLVVMLISSFLPNAVFPALIEETSYSASASSSQQSENPEDGWEVQAMLNEPQIPLDEEDGEETEDAMMATRRQDSPMEGTEGQEPKGIVQRLLQYFRPYGTCSLLLLWTE